MKHLNKSGRFPSGNVRYYYRPKGMKGVPLPDLPQDDPRWLAAYAEAAGVTPRPTARTGSIGAGITAYKASDRFLSLAANTRAQRGRILDHISQDYGHAPLSGLRAKHVRADLDKFQGHAANNRLKSWRGFLAWAAEAGIITEDPSQGIRKRRTAKTEGHVPWSDADVAAFRARWPLDTPQRLAFELIHWTGARVSDAVKLGEGHVGADGFLAFAQTKTGGEAFVPMRADVSPLARALAADLDALDRALAARPKRHLTFITTEAGASRSVKAVSQWFAAAARAAGLEDRTAHGLRKTRAVALLYAGATHHQVGAWTGHESLKEIEHYARGRDRRRVLRGGGSGTESSNSADQVPKAAKK